VTLSSLALIRQAARAGDTLRAWHMFESAGLLESAEDDALSLRGRLLKDRALKSSDEERSSLFDEAEAAYLRAAGDRRATYPLINAATIAFLNGKPERARELADQTIALLDSGDHEPETSYWLGATRAEAELLLGRVAAGKAALERAIAGTPAAWEDHAATLRQLRFVLEHMGHATDILDHLRPPASLHFSGLIGLPAEDEEVRAAIGAALDTIRPGFVFGALAAGADIVIAELAVARGVHLHVVLPAPVDLFRDESVARFGAHWTERFDRLIEAADVVETVSDVDRLSEAAIVLGEEISMGLALRRARTLASEAVALRVRRPTDTASPSERVWRDRGLAYHDIMVERSAARGDHCLVERNRCAVLALATPCSSEIVPAAGGRRANGGGAYDPVCRAARRGGDARRRYPARDARQPDRPGLPGRGSRRRWFCGSCRNSDPAGPRRAAIEHFCRLSRSAGARTARARSRLRIGRRDHHAAG
jgi:tetratricopeptide (TPR) repeat protein